MHACSTDLRAHAAALAQAAAVVVLTVASGLAAQPVRLTSLAGNETEAAWSPDGAQIAFQQEIDGDRDILILDVATGATRAVVAGDGQACYPCWSPDGRGLIYSYGHLTTTAAQAVGQGRDEGFNLWRVPVAGGQPVQLTTGRCRDYTPAIAPDGRMLWFTSTRGFSKYNAALWRLPIGDAAMVYGQPNQVRIGCQFDGTSTFPGRMRFLEVGAGAPAVYLTREQALREFHQP